MFSKDNTKLLKETLLQKQRYIADFRRLLPRYLVQEVKEMVNTKFSSLRFFVSMSL